MPVLPASGVRMPVLPLALPSSRMQRSFSEPVIESQRGLPMVAPAAPVAEPLTDGEVLPLVLPLAPTEPEVDGVDGEVDGVVTLPPAPARPLTSVEVLPLGCAAVLPDVDAPALPCP
jgi:hypothetical protein